jgi:hypothetical protein
MEPKIFISSNIRADWARGILINNHLAAPALPFARRQRRTLNR